MGGERRGGRDEEWMALSSSLSSWSKEGSEWRRVLWERKERERGLDCL